MTTMEKLLVQIFERKKWIIEQAKQQAEMYNHHVASKLLIDGIAPPSWLLSPNSSSDFKELNKEDLISRLLHPYPQPPVCRSSAQYPLYSNLVGTGDKFDFSDGFFLESLVCNEGPSGHNHPPAPAISSEDDAGHTSNNVSDLDVSITSPVDQTDQRISCIYSAPDQSLARIQRSKSRQKALELRSSGKSLTKNRLSHENINDNFRLSIFSTEQVSRQDELPEGCKELVFNESVCQSNENDIDGIGTSNELGCAPDSCRKDVSSSCANVGTKRPVSDLNPKQSDCVNKLQKSGSSTVCFQSSAVRSLDEEDCQGRDTENNVSTENITRSDFSCKRAGDSSEAGSSDNAQRNHNEIMDYLPADYALGPLVSVTGANVFGKGCNSHPSIAEDCKNGKATSVDPYNRMTGSSSSSPHNVCADGTLHQDISSNFNEADSSPLPPSSERLAPQTNAPSEEPGLVEFSFGMIDEQRDTEMAVRSELVLRDQLDQSVSSSSVDTNRRIELESVVAPSPTTSLVSAEPNELDTDMHKEYNLKIPTSISGKKRLNDVSEKTSCSFLDLAASVDNVILRNVDRLSIAEASTQRSDVHSKGGDGLNCDYSEVQDEINIMHLEVDDTPDSLSDPVKLHLDHNHDSLPVHHSEEGNWDASRRSYSVDSIQRADSHDDLVEKGEVANPTVDIHDKTKQIHTEDFQVLPCLDVSGQHAELPRGEGGLTITTADGSPVSGSWPQIRRMEKLLNISTAYLMNIEKDVDLADAFRVIKSNTEAGLNCDYSKVQNEINIMQSEVEDTPDLLNHPMKLYLDHSHDSLPEQCSEEGNWKACRRSYSLDLIKMADSHDDLVMKGEAANPAYDIHDKTKQIRAEDCQDLPCLDVSGQHTELTLEESGFSITSADGSPAFLSWPQLKRRKIEHQQETNRHTTSPCIRMKKFLSMERCPSSTDLMNMENDVDLADSFRVTKSTEMETNQLSGFNLAEVESTFESQNGENRLCSKEQNEQQSSSTVNEQFEIILVASPTKKRARNSDEQYVEGMRTHSSLDHLDAKDIDDKQCSQHSSFLDKDIVDNITNEKPTLNRMIQGTITSQWEDGQKSQCLVGSPSDNHLEFDAVDQSMPVYEGFMVDAQANSRELDFLEDEVDFDQLKLPSSTIERAGILAKICRSASTNTTPLSDSSSASEFQANLFKSVPNGLLKSLDTSSLTLNGNVHKNLRFGNRLVNNVKDSFERMPYYSDSLAYSGARFGWNSRYLYESPVGKFSERLSSQSSSSEKRLSVNPDLTCFRIEEDFCVGEENEIMDGDKRQPLKETTNLGLIPPDTKYKVKQGLEKQTSTVGNTGVLENQALSFGAVQIKKGKESINNSVNKTVLRSKSSLNRPEQKLSLKETGRNNIVSHVSSFLPLVQPRKGAAPPGKREVKVKALETAEAAKRLEEQRENERKIKKEALKAERAKLEEKNLRQMKLEKKKKEDERKKKDADILARKRLREEEERKEREKKRMRLEARQRQREQEEERVRAKKSEKENDHSKGEKMNSKKELNESKKPQNKEIVRGQYDAALKNTEVKRSPARSELYNEECGISGHSFEAEKAMHTVDKSPTSEMLIVQKSQEKSYEISPYQCSDGEDEEDDELPTQKYVPSWASKSSVALVLPLQQEMDPDSIFLPKSYCSVEEVLFPCNVH